MSLRWSWSLTAVMMVIIVALSMMASIADVERRAWKASEDEQARLLVTLLADELKMPMLAGSQTEVETLIQMFTLRVPGTVVFLHWASGDTAKFGKGPVPEQIEGIEKLEAQAVAVQGAQKWYATGVKYNAAQLGSVAMFVPGTAWEASDSEIKLRVAAVAAIIALLAGLIVYMRSGRVVDYLRMIARACKRVGGGDFTVHVPVQSTNEFGKAANQFNLMVSNLEQREKVYDLYGDFQRPQAVADEYERNAQRADKSREVSVLSIDMVGFNRYLSGVESQDDAFNMINRCFLLFQIIVQEFGGHVESFSGDSMIVVFNHPFELKQHENQAAKAGIAIVEACKALDLERPDGSKVKFRVGLDIGEVVIGHLGIGRRKSLAILGRPISRAAQVARAANVAALAAPYGTMLSLGHGFKQKDLGSRRLSNGEEQRCIVILPGETYVEQEVEAAVEKGMMRVDPAAFYGDDDDDDGEW